MQKLLFTSLNDHVCWGGSEVLWSEVAMKLANDHYVSVLVKKWDNTPDQIKAIEANGAVLFFKPIVRVQAFKELILEKLKCKLGFKIKKQKVDIEVVTGIHTFDLVILSLGDHADHKLISYTQYLRQINKPYVLIVQLATSLRYLDDNRMLQFKEAYLHAKAVCYLSEENLDAIEMQFGVILTNTLKINNPFYYKQIYVEPIEQESYNIACVAALTTLHKGQDLLLKVLSNRKWKSRNVVFNLYGTGVNEKQIERLISQYNLDDKVILMGHETNKNKIWEGNVACVMPSRMEGQSLAMLEAMAYGRMVISTKVGDAGRLIEDGKTGYLIEAPTVELIDEALERAWGNRNDWIEMGKLSREHLYKIIHIDPVEDFSKKLQTLLT